MAVITVRPVVRWSVFRGRFALFFCFISRSGFIGLVVVLVGGPRWKIVLVHDTVLTAQGHK